MTEPSAPTIVHALLPFVEKHEPAGAVTLVASKDKVLDVATGGWADIAAKSPCMQMPSCGLPQ